MKVSPIASPGNSLPTSGAPAQSLRSLRMNTNATPGRIEDLPPDPSLTIPDTSEHATAVDEVTQPLSPQLAAIAKQRRALQVKERELADREKALLTQSPVPGGGVDLARLKSEPLSVLLEAGVTYEQLTQAILANQDGDSSQVVEARIRALEESFDKKLADRDQQSEKQVLAEMQREATSLAAEGDDFEMVRETRSIPDVMKLIERTYKETGEVLDVKEALQLVETELVNESLKIARLKKVQSQIAPPPAPPPPPNQHRQMRTLTNRDTASVPMTAKQRALAAFNGTLKR